MKPYITIALKSIRNKKQHSFVTIILSTISTTILIFTTAFMSGEHRVFLQNAVEVYPSYIQITNKDFRDNPSYDNLIFNTKQVKHKLKNLASIDTFSERFETFVLLSSDKKSQGVMLSGINPLQEQRISRLKKSLLSGEYLAPSDTNKLYIGNELAKSLHVDIGDKLSFVGTGADYSFAAENVIIKGIFQTGLFEFDNSSAFLNKAYFDEVFVSENIATHIIVLPKDIKQSEQINTQIQKSLGSNLSSQSWHTFMHGLIQAMEIDGILGYITLFVLFAVVFFVISIYTFINVFSRIKEIGILRAIGTKQNEIFKMLVFESALLSFISIVIGGILGAILTYYFHINPIEFGAEYQEQFKQYGLINPTSLPTDFNVINIFRDMLIIFVLCVGSMFYPILKINSYRPIEAIRYV